MNQMLNMLFGQNNPAMSNLLGMAQSAGLIDIAMQGYRAYQEGKLPEFMQYQYDNNIHFRKFYDKNKNKTFSEFFSEKNINLE